MREKFCHTLILFYAFILIGCSVPKSFMVHTAIPLIKDQRLATMRETDYKFAKIALPSNIKQIEGVIISDPKNTNLKLWACEALSGYAVGFMEDDNPKGASGLYLRARDYAIDAAIRKIKFKREYMNDYARLTNWIQSCDKKSVPYLYWLGSSWGSWIAINLNNPEALADMLKVQSIMNRVIELDESFYHGGAHVVLGSIFSSIPPFLGGKPNKAVEHFKKCMEMSHREFLLAQYYEAKTYCVMIQDSALFDSLIAEIEKFDVTRNPDLQLTNTIAKHRAQRLKSKRKELFIDEAE